MLDLFQEIKGLNPQPHSGYGGTVWISGDVAVWCLYKRLIRGQTFDTSTDKANVQYVFFGFNVFHHLSARPVFTPTCTIPCFLLHATGQLVLVISEIIGALRTQAVQHSRSNAELICTHAD